MFRRIPCALGALACLLQACVSTGIDAESRKDASESAVIAGAGAFEYAKKGTTFQKISEQAVENARAAAVDAQLYLVEIRGSGAKKQIASAESACKVAARERTVAEDSFQQLRTWVNALQLAADAAQEQARQALKPGNEGSVQQYVRQAMKREKECSLLLARIEKTGTALKQRWLLLSEPPQPAQPAPAASASAPTTTTIPSAPRAGGN